MKLGWMVKEQQRRRAELWFWLKLLEISAVWHPSLNCTM
jgi:hypothetical protein